MTSAYKSDFARSRKVRGDSPVRRGAASPGSEDHRIRVGAARRENTRQRLLSAAVTVFAEKGLDAPAIDEFISAAGVSRGTFYNHFKTTNELLLALTAELNDKVSSAIEQNVRRYPDPLKSLTCAVLLYMHLAVDYPAWGDFVLRAGLRNGKYLYLRRDLMAALESGLASFPSVDVAQDLVLGCVSEGIDSVLRARVKRHHLRDITFVMLRGLGVAKATAERLAATPEEQIELPQLLANLHHGPG